MIALLVACSLYVITSKPTVLGLDLKGGTELVYQGASERRRSRRSRPRTSTGRSRSSATASTRSASPSPRSRARLGPDPGRPPERLERPARHRADRHHRAALPLRLRAERHPAEPGRAEPGGSRPYTRLIDAVEAASEQPEVSDASSAEKQGCTTSGRHVLPVRQELARADRRAVGGRVRPLSSTSRRQATPPDTKVVAVPRGTIVVEDKPDDDPATRRRRVGRAVGVLRPPRSPGPVRRRDHRPEADTDQFNQPIVDLQLHRLRPRGVLERDRGDRGARADACARQTAAPCAGISSNDAELLGLVRDRARRRAGLEPDHQLRRQPGRDRRAHRRPDLRGQRPGGPRPRRGAEDRRAADQARADQPVARSRRRSASRRSTRASRPASSASPSSSSS